VTTSNEDSEKKVKKPRRIWTNHQKNYVGQIKGSKKVKWGEKTHKSRRKKKGGGKKKQKEGNFAGHPKTLRQKLYTGNVRKKGFTNQ